MSTEKGSSVSVLGLGLMGSALAEALLNAGHGVTVWNRTPGKAGSLTEKGANAAASAAEAFDASDVILVCVTNHAAVMEIVFEEFRQFSREPKLLLLVKRSVQFWWLIRP